MKTLHALRIFALPLAAFGLLAAAPAHAADNGDYSSKTQVSGDAAGNYDSKSTSEATDDNGTTQTSTVKEKNRVNSSGDVKVSKSSEKTVDPEGLGNKATAETSQKTETSANGDVDAKAVSETESAAGATDKDVTTKKVRVDRKGHRKTKVVHKKSHDPKGLMNKTTEKTTDTSEQKDNGQVETTHETDVNGTATEKTDETH